MAATTEFFVNNPVHVFGTGINAVDGLKATVTTVNAYSATLGNTYVVTMVVSGRVLTVNESNLALAKNSLP